MLENLLLSLEATNDPTILEYLPELPSSSDVHPSTASNDYEPIDGHNSEREESSGKFLFPEFTLF